MRLHIQAVIFRRRDKKLEFLVLHRTKERGGFWQNLTGGVEKGETPTLALKREIEEETGIAKSKIKRIVKDIYCFEWFSDRLNQKIKEYVFAVEIDPRAEIKLSEEHDNYKWCEAEEAKKLFRWESHSIAVDKTLRLIKSEHQTCNSNVAFFPASNRKLNSNL